MAPPPPRAMTALNAMKTIGFPVTTVKTVLKNLLKVYDNNWEYIEAENYRVLADAILDSQEDGSKKKDAVNEEPEPLKKRLRVRPEEPNLSPPIRSPDGPHGAPPKRVKTEETESSRPSVREVMTRDATPQPSPRSEIARPVSPQMNSRVMRSSNSVQEMSPLQDKGESGSLRTYRRDKRPMNETARSPIYYKEPKIEPGTEVLPRNATARITTAPLMPKDEPADFETPIAVMPPIHLIAAGNQVHQNQATRDDSSSGNGFSRLTNDSENPAAQHETIENMEKGYHEGAETSATQHEDKGSGENSSDAAHKNGNKSELVSVEEAASAANLDVASSAMGEVKLSLTCNLNGPDFRMPSLDDVIKLVENRCLKSFKIFSPDFSVMNLMKEICQCVVQLGSDSTVDKEENMVKVTPVLESLKRHPAHSNFAGASASSCGGSQKLVACEDSRIENMNGLHAIPEHGNKGNGRADKNKESVLQGDSYAASHSLVIVHQPQLALGDVRPLHDATDISKGEERVRIPVVNEVSNEKLPSSFHYIQHNIVYQNAYLNFSLARIGDESCCSDCFGDCLAAPIPCACARETGGEFAYTSDGLMKKDLLDDYIAMNRDPPKHRLFYCKDCPLERSKNEVKPQKCRGHTVRKFIKECWSKCGCSKQCGNRVVQRGITCNLQVFFTAEGKGWGLRTLDELPRGAFVCEYVGEVLTNMELYYRTIHKTRNARHTYPVLLDADWGSEGVLKDEDALCLDATFYGNAARFVNHRCYDANLIEIPVEVETPDHHYYHLAFFTTRKIEAFEELTWDYGIDFDDHNHPIKAFRCRCGSRLCRDKKRSQNRARALVLG